MTSLSISPIKQLPAKMRLKKQKVNRRLVFSSDDENVDPAVNDVINRGDSHSTPIRTKQVECTPFERLPAIKRKRGKTMKKGAFCLFCFCSHQKSFVRYPYFLVFLFSFFVYFLRMLATMPYKSPNSRLHTRKKCRTSFT